MCRNYRNNVDVGNFCSRTHGRNWKKKFVSQPNHSMSLKFLNFLSPLESNNQSDIIAPSLPAEAPIDGMSSAMMNSTCSDQSSFSWTNGRKFCTNYYYNRKLSSNTEINRDCFIYSISKYSDCCFCCKFLVNLQIVFLI